MAAKHLRVWGAARQLLIVRTHGAAAAKPKEDHANALYTPIERFVRCHEIGSCPSDRREGVGRLLVGVRHVQSFNTMLHHILIMIPSKFSSLSTCFRHYDARA